MTVLDLLIFTIFGIEIEFGFEFITSRPGDFPNSQILLIFLWLLVKDNVFEKS